MKEYDTYPALVIDNNSLNSPEAVENGAIQVYIECLMQDIPTDLYPWVLPTTEWSCFPPEIDDYVWVHFLDIDNWRNGFYGDLVSKKSAFTHSSSIGTITSTYPDVKYITLANGVSIALSANSTTPEISLYHPSGAEIYVDPDGLVSIKGAAGTLEFSLLGETTKQLISDLLTALINHTHGTGVGPSSVPINLTAFQNLLNTTLPTIISSEVKTS